MEEQNEQLPAIGKGNFFERLEAIELVDGRLQMRTAADVYRISRIVKNAGLGQRDWTETQVFMVLLNGLRLGLDPNEAMQSSYVVNNRVSLFGSIPKAMIEASGLLEAYEECYEGKPFEDDFKAVVVSKRKGRKPLTSEYSVLEAKEAGLWDKSVIDRDGQEKAPWQLARKRMLMWRARHYNWSDNFPDVLKGVAIREVEETTPGFEGAKPARGRIVEPRFETMPAKPETPAAAAPAVEPPPKPVSPSPEPAGEPPKPKPDGTPPHRGRGLRRKAPPATDMFEPGLVTKTEQIAAAVPLAVPLAVPSAAPSAAPSAVPEDKSPTLSGPTAEVMRRLEADKLDLIAFIRVMSQNGFLEVDAEGATLADVLDEGLQTALDQWPKIVEYLREEADDKKFAS